MMLDGNYSKPTLLQVINTLNSKSLYLYTSTNIVPVIF